MPRTMLTIAAALCTVLFQVEAADTACAVTRGGTENSGWDRQRRTLGKFGFERRSYEKMSYTVENFRNFSERNMEYLCANGEIGGLVLLPGTGFQFFFSNNNWRDKNGRTADRGLHVLCRDYHVDEATFLEQVKITKYIQHLGLEDGVVSTEIGFGEDQLGYKTTLFVSQKNKNLVCMTVTNTEREEKVWTVALPDAGYETKERVLASGSCIIGWRDSAEYFTKTAFALHSDKQIMHGGIALSPGETAVLRFAFTTSIGEGEAYEDAAEAFLEMDKTYGELLAGHREVWRRYWTDAPFVQTPDEEINKLFYRALYWELCQHGGKKNLSPEAAFASLRGDCSELWDGHPFSYGAPGQAVESLLMVGRSDLARNILDVMYRPEALRANAKRYTDMDGAFSFAHENDINGFEIAPKSWGTQRHIDGFVADLYRKYHECNPEEKSFFSDRVYPVFRGVAQFYRGTLTYSEEYGAYLFPKWVFVSEFGARTNTLDVVLNAVFVFKQAAEYASELGVDEKDAREWLRLSDRLHVPQNDEIYLQYTGDAGRTSEGGGYFGKRAQLYLGIPYLLERGYVDEAKARRTLLSAWEDNRRGSGMITFVAGWGAKTAARFGMGNLSLEMLKRYFDCNPGFISETESGKPYFQCGFVKSLLSLFVQGDYGTIRAFRAVPDAWGDVTFENVTTINGIKVSGTWRHGKAERLVFRSADGRLIHTQSSNAPFDASRLSPGGK